MISAIRNGKEAHTAAPIGTLNILLVNSDPDDAWLALRNFEKFDADTLHVVWNSTEALDYLEHVLSGSDRVRYPEPDAIFIDLSVLEASNFELLSWLAEKEHTHAKIPVIVIADYCHGPGVRKVLQLGASACMEKPVKWAAALAQVRQLTEKVSSDKEF